MSVLVGLLAIWIAHRIEVERNELIEEFDMYDEAGTKLCRSGRLFSSARRIARDSSRSIR
jgi:hypothetical protein